MLSKSITKRKERKKAMTIILKTVVVDGIGTESKMVIITGAESYREFQDLIQRGAGLSPDLKPSVKQFADMVTAGKVLQDYHGQDGSLPANGYEEHIFQLSNYK